MSSTVATPRQHQLAVPPPLRPRLVSSAGGHVQVPGALPAAHSSVHTVTHSASLTGSLAGAHPATFSASLTGSLAGAHPATFSAAHSGMVPVAHSHAGGHPALHPGLLSGALQVPVPAAHQAAALTEHGALPPEPVEFQIKLSDGQVIPLAMPPEPAAGAARMSGRLTTPPEGAAAAGGGEMAGAPGSVREVCSVGSLARLLFDPSERYVPCAAWHVRCFCSLVLSISKLTLFDGGSLSIAKRLGWDELLKLCEGSVQRRKLVSAIPETAAI